MYYAYLKLINVYLDKIKTNLYYSSSPSNGRPTKEDKEPTTAKEGAEKLAKEKGRHEPKKEQVRGQFGPGDGAEDQGGT